MTVTFFCKICVPPLAMLLSEITSVPFSGFTTIAVTLEALHEPLTPEIEILPPDCLKLMLSSRVVPVTVSTPTRLSDTVTFPTTVPFTFGGLPGAATSVSPELFRCTTRPPDKQTRAVPKPLDTVRYLLRTWLPPLAILVSAM